jgi:hypothetical protein
MILSFVPSFNEKYLSWCTLCKIGRLPCYGISKNERKPPARSIVKGNFSKGSTLMKPTASQLARQTRPLEVKNVMPYVNRCFVLIDLLIYFLGLITEVICMVYHL